MVDRVTAASDADEALRAYLEGRLDGEVPVAFDTACQRRESGELPRTIEEGHLSEFPASVRSE